MDFCLQSEEIDRLRVVVVTTDFKSPRPICRQCVPRQSDYGYATRGCVRFKPLRHFPAIHDRQADIHQDDIGRLGAREIVSLRAILGGNHLVSFSHETLGQHITVHFVVFDQQDRGHGLILLDRDPCLLGRGPAIRQNGLVSRDHYRSRSCGPKWSTRTASMALLHESSVLRYFRRW
jgi:hypothetical protein